MTVIALFFLIYLKFSSKMSDTLIHYIKQHSYFLKLWFDCFITCNVFNIACCIDMDSFRDTSEAGILVTFYIVLCLQNKTFVDRIRNIVELVIVVANLLNIWLPYCGVFFCHLRDLFHRYNVSFYSIKKYEVLFITLF